MGEEAADLRPGQRSLESCDLPWRYDRVDFLLGERGSVDGRKSFKTDACSVELLRSRGAAFDGVIKVDNVDWPIDRGHRSPDVKTTREFYQREAVVQLTKLSLGNSTLS
jgi:hypothetical protein